jgi:mitogen-activated protein kinase kinase kinase
MHRGSIIPQLVLLGGLDHPNIVRYLGTSRDESGLLIFLEYVPVSPSLV